MFTEIKADNIHPPSVALPSGGAVEWAEALHEDPRESSALRTPSPEWVSEWASK